jgi:transposase
MRELHALVDRLQALQDMHQQECNRLEALDQSPLQREPSRVVEMVQDHIDWLSAQIADIESDIHDHIDNNPHLKRDADLIRSIPSGIPGCGPKLAVQFLAYVGDVRRFKSAV